MTLVYPSGEITPLAARKLQDGDEPIVGYASPNGHVAWNMMGPLAPIVGPALQEGVTMQSLKGLIAIWQTQDQQGANQDGTTFTGAVYDPIVVDMNVTAHGRTPKGTRTVIRRWIESWDVRTQGKLWCITPDGGYWFAPVRWFKTPTEALMRSSACKQPFTWTARADDGFWRATDSVSKYPDPDEGTALSGGAGTGFNTVTNIGDQKGWVDHVFHGPGTVQIANGVDGSLITFGPLLAGQIALLRTEPRRRGVYDLTPAGTNVPQQQLTEWQSFLKSLINFATNNNVVPLLQQFESFFGILPPQGEFYTLLNGRFTESIAPKPAGLPPVESRLQVTITGGDANTRLETRLTPLRRYPL